METGRWTRNTQGSAAGDTEKRFSLIAVTESALQGNPVALTDSDSVFLLESQLSYPQVDHSRPKGEKSITQVK